MTAIPELVGAAESAALLGIGTPNFSHLRADEDAKGETSLFPRPVQVLRCGPIWVKADMETFAATYRNRKPGAPAKPKTDSSTVAKKMVRKHQSSGTKV